MAARKIRQEILATADYHPAGLYAFGRPSPDGGVASNHASSTSGLLTFYRSLEIDVDALSTQFVPLSATAQKGRNPKVFAIGVLPPNQKVTGRLLDRSASVASSIAAYAPSQEEILNTNPDELSIEEDIRMYDQGNILPERVANRNQTRLSGLDPAFQPLVEKMIELAAQRGIQLVITSGFRSADEQNALYAKGRTAPGPVVTNVPAGRSWHNYGLAVDFAVFNGTKTEIPNPPPASVLQDVWGPIGEIGTSLGMNWGASYGDYPHFDWHPGVNIASAAAGARPEAANPAPRPVQADSVSGDFVEGSKLAADARKQQGKLTDTDIRNLQDGLLQAQKAQIQAIQNALSAMANTPPLRMLVNPSKFSVKSTKIVQDGNWGRDGPIIEFWGDDQDKISGSGKVAGFYALDREPKFQGGGPGLTRAARNFSQSWQNFQALFLIYKNNGGVYLSETLSQESRDLLLSTVGSIYIYYDNILYFGSFDSLNITEADTAPFTVDYSFEFTVRASFILDLPSEFEGTGQELVQNQRAAAPTRSTADETSDIVRENGSEAAADLLVSGGGIGGII